MSLPDFLSSPEAEPEANEGENDEDEDEELNRKPKRSKLIDVQIPRNIMRAPMVTAAKVINDTAERAIKLASDYAKSLTKDSKMRQKLFQTVEWHRREKAGRTKKSTANK